MYSGGSVYMTSGVIQDNWDFTSDFSATGWEADQLGDFNIRNLIVRESARFRELIIDQLAVIAGSTLLSVARGKIKDTPATDGTLASNQITLEDPNNRGTTRFIDNDFFWVKSLDIDNATITDLKGQVTTSGITLTLDTTVSGGTHAGTTTDISSLSPGDVIVQRGHPTDVDRQNLIYKTVSDTDAPVLKFLTNIDSLGAFDTSSNITTQLGNLSGLTGLDTINGQAISGNGLYSQNAFLKGGIAATYGSIGGFDITGTTIQSTDGTSILIDSSAPKISLNSDDILLTASSTATAAGFEVDGATAIRLSADGTGLGGSNYASIFYNDAST